MEAYTGFAQVYDLFMDNVPYEQWCAFIDEILQEYGIEENIVLDLGCGTGTMTRMMSDKGYDMIGVDNSAEMLDIARELEYDRIAEAEAAEWADSGAEEESGSEEETGSDEESGSEEETGSEEESGIDAESAAEGIPENSESGDDGISGMIAPPEEEYYDTAYTGSKTPDLYLCQDMRELELYGTIGACYCSCDCLNYILEEGDVRKVFSLVNNYLFPGGLFIFDINTPYKYEKLLADNTIAENRPEGSFIWENSYDPESRINIYDLTLYIREDLALEQGEYGDEEAEYSEAGYSDAAYGEDEYGEDDRPQEDGTQGFGPQLMPYYRYQETHYQKCYSRECIEQLLKEAGMELIAVYDSYSRNPVRPDSEKITFIAREHGKKKG